MASSLIEEADSTRSILGAGFSLDFPNRIQTCLDADVLVIDIKGDSYAMHVAGRQVIIVKRCPVWTRQNFSLAHELGHLHFESFHTPDDDHGSAEMQANAYAAELLMPVNLISSTRWSSLSLSELAQLVWELGVSNEALSTRLNALHCTTSVDVQSALSTNTTKFLRHYLAVSPEEDLISARRAAAAERRVPFRLVSRLERAVEQGLAPVESLAFLLDINPATIDQPEADDGIASTQALLDWIR